MSVNNNDIESISPKNKHEKLQNNPDQKSISMSKAEDSTTTITNLELLNEYPLSRRKQHKATTTTSSQNSTDQSLFSTITKSTTSSHITFGSSKNKSKSISSSSSISRKRKRKKHLPSESKLCSQSFSMIKFLGTINTKKLELRADPRSRRSNFHDWIGCLEVAFSNYKHTRKILNDYSTTQRIHKVKSKSINRFVYSVCYAFMDKSVRISTSSYKDDGVGLLRALFIKCATVDSKAKERAKQAFLECRIG